MSRFLTTPQGRSIAYNQTEGAGVGVVFLGGFMSDMEGSKALYLEDWARREGRPFLRFDYSGHGESSGAFEEGCIGDWAQDAQAVIEALTHGPQVLIGSSMGGWISLLMTKRLGARVGGLVTIAAAPDFTEDGFWAGFTAEQRAELARTGRVLVPSDYDAPYPITKRLIEDGRNQLVLRTPLTLDLPVLMLQGTADTSVSVQTAMRLFEHASGADIRLLLVKGADHRFSSVRELGQISFSAERVLERLE
ncbi:Alpha/beta hydrolase family protein [Aquimixticola soesokkakensis]|uniref:Palmitoyl-protein thioesterase ABHD10, mitochondrial n=1 Tax=Aquimixticola soesokkakensis TaxID=1519096 RepID=A0A1Y5T1N3_9RHOB|nr:alpha/beta hydrolase [Aquimixticola soesokkakensis]SLN50139.1 Alpha/beta hydrolase family protein [Aquimixticola soesokkakensis]